MQTDGEDEQNQTEFAYEFENVFINAVSERSHDNAYKQHESHTQRYPEQFAFAQIYADGDDKRVKHQRGRDTVAAGRKKFLEKIHI